MKLFDLFNRLPSAVKGLLGVAAVFASFAGYIVLATVADKPKPENVYAIENGIDQNLLLSLDDDKPSAPEPKPIKEIVISKDSFTPKSKKPKPTKKTSYKKGVAKKRVKKPHQTRKIRKISTRQKPPASPGADTVDPRMARIRRFNSKRLTFSKVSYAFNTTSKKQHQDNNKQDSWPVKKDQNTYPTDLSRVVTKEKFISAILNNRIDSTFGGKMIFTIDHNVYGAQGANILIPIGTKASGNYVPVDKIGVERLSMSIERMVTPDGQLILFLNPATVADSQGATGVQGDVDHKYLQKFGLPLAFSVANNTVSLAFQRLIDAMSDPDKKDSTLSQIFNEQWSKDQSATNREIISDIIKNNIKIMPTISIEPGSKILLFLDQDIWFKPNKNGTTEVVQAQTAANTNRRL